MENYVAAQLQQLGAAAALGGAAGLVYDVLRSARLLDRRDRRLTHLLDGVFAALLGAGLLWLALVVGEGELRLYMVTGMLLGGVILGLLSRVWTQEVTLDAQTVMGILLIGVVGTAMAFTLYLQGVNDIGPVKTSLLSCAELVTAGVLTSVWLKTPLAWQDVLGMALILGMVAFLAVPGRTTPNTTRSNS